VRRGDRHAKAKAALERVGLGHRLGHRPTQLSGGEQQRSAIARALVHDPPLLLADEPTGNLDSETGRNILKLVDDLHDEGRTVVLITHDPNVADHAPRRILIKDGMIESDVRREPVA
jgi:putative ABC transport system ATP-binding protein